MSGELTVLQNLKISIDTDREAPPHFLAVLEKHHDYLEASLAVLEDKHSSDDDLQVSFMRLTHVHKMHGQAKSELLYPEIFELVQTEARAVALIGDEEQKLITRLINEMQSMGAQSLWSDRFSAKAKILVSLLRSHLQLEEMTLFPLVKKVLDPEVLEQMSVSYLERCSQYLELELGMLIDEEEVTRSLTLQTNDSSESSIARH